MCLFHSFNASSGGICMGWMPRQRPEELDQSMVPGAKQLEDQTNNNIAMQAQFQMCIRFHSLKALSYS